MVVEEYVQGSDGIYQEMPTMYIQLLRERSKPVDHPFKIMGVDIMELPLITKGNKYLIAFQDLFTKWPMAFPTPDQKTE